MQGAKDPDELIQENPALWQAAIERHTPAVDWVIDQYAEREDLATADGKKTLATKALGLIRNLRDPVDQEFYLKKVSRLTEVSLTALMQKMSSGGNNNTPSRRMLKPTKVTRREYTRRDEKYLLDNILAIALSQPRLRSVLHNLPDTYLTGTSGKAKYHLLGEKIEVDSELADKLAELEIVADRELDNVDERALLLGYLRELELSKLKARFEQLSRELAPRKIRVNAVAPGPTNTPIMQGIPAEWITAMESGVPLGRMADPAEIAAAVAYLASDDASYVTGSVLVANGGSYFF